MQQHNCLHWLESTLSALSTIRGNREREDRGEVEEVRLHRALKWRVKERILFQTGFEGL